MIKIKCLGSYFWEGDFKNMIITAYLTKLFEIVLNDLLIVTCLVILKTISFMEKLFVLYSSMYLAN